ncbi:MAG: ABC transporter ATP-binding protein [Dolichospermum sp. DET50]|nr:ABC transporter ATP-binding protein [Dolichospermum sp. DET66]MBS3035084.1 ABC transporter ATP-binding protein [Dolichospermum sp. DET67]MBS3040284.1 ABC transporter ATP-binding protein [Dolichospermum sp. DET50]QSX67442.1 MAG: ABC transporter ATP-binding protein [Dolichospermum sp. DET69]
MSDTVIRVENLGKKYIIGHQKQERYTALRDVITNKVKSIGNLINPQAKNENPGFEEFWALKDVSFEVKQGDRVGIIGRNGAGKSTLLKILSRITEPTKGSIKIKGRVASLLEVGTGFHPELTGRENIFLNGAILGMGKEEIKRKFDEIVAFAEVEKFLDTPVKRYSSGMYVRLAFAVAAHLEPEILIVDEVLAVGDAAFQKKCLGKMEDVAEKEGRTVLFVSHNMGAVESLCNRGIYLENGHISYSGFMQETLKRYLTFSRMGCDYLTPGILFQREYEEKIGVVQILEVSLLDQNFQLKAFVKTWDYLRIRIKYYATKYISNGSVVLEIATFSGHKLIQYSTQPLSGIELQIVKGESFIECTIPCLPLSSGIYKLSVGLAIPMTEMLCWEENIATLEINNNDVYCSKFPPHQDRTTLAIEHYWKIPENATTNKNVS